MLQAQFDNQLRFAMNRLLHNLRKYIHVYAMRPNIEMPEHNPVWIRDMDRGPENEILDAIKANPELWRNAVPEECCIVPRKTLVGFGVTPNHIEHLEAIGASIIDARAHHLRYEAEQKERQRRPSVVRPNSR